MPERAPRVHTLVARKACWCISGLISSPSTSSALEYIGEVSMRRAPAAKKPSSTSLSGARSAGEAPTSKLREGPSPMTGRSSPLGGVLPLSGAAADPPALVRDSAAAAMSCAPRAMSSRRFMSDERRVGAGDTRAAALDHARERDRPGQDLRGIEAGGANLGGVELAVGTVAPSGCDRRRLREQPAADHVSADAQERHPHP